MLRLWADQVVKLEFAESLSHESVRQLLKTPLNPGRNRRGVSRKSAETLWPQWKMMAEVCASIPAKPGKPAREESEYKRMGVRDLMMICEPKRGVREVLMTERRTKIDFAQSLKHIVELYPQADVIRVVQDTLNTHKMGALYEAFPPQEARAIASKLEFHTTPKHGSELNIAEIEWAMLSNRCPNRIPNEETLRKHVETNVKERNTKAESVKWRFNTQDARRKLARLYPSVST
jgi:hypothetical protein